MTVQTQPEDPTRTPIPAPPNDPAMRRPDSYCETPFLADYKARRQAFFAHLLQNPAENNTKPIWHELARLCAGATPHEDHYHATLDFIDARNDCADFVLHAVLRLLESSEQRVKTSCQIPTQFLSPALIARSKQTVLNFKYFPDEPGLDSLCTWTENHYILYTSAGYLAGQMYPDEVFSNSGEIGRQKAEKNRPRILRWLEMRFRSGFSEWLSHVYYDEDLVALLSLYDFAEDDEICHKAEIVINLILLDMALNSFKGVFGSTHGRSYENSKKWARNEGTTDTFKLLFGMGVFSAHGSMSAISFALSGFKLSPVLIAIAQEANQSYVNRQRMGHRVEDAQKWGLTYDDQDLESGMIFLTNEAYLHPKTAALTLNMLDAFYWWQNSFLIDFSAYRGLLKCLKALKLLPALGRFLERDVCRNMRQEVNIYTYKTPDTMLSTAQDYRKGYGGDQQHIWQATLGQDAVCFTTHPAKFEGESPNYWTGDGLLPRAYQYQNVCIVCYNIEKIPALYVPIRHFYTHAWLPKDKFDEVVEKNGWIFARKGMGYLALRSQHPYFWTNDAISRRIGALNPVEQSAIQPDCADNEIIVKGKRNIWICQMGRRSEDGEFAEFVQKVSKAEVTFSRMNVTYLSPSAGMLQFGWDQPFRVDNQTISQQDYPRYDNPYVQAEFDPTDIQVKFNQEVLDLNWEIGDGQISHLPGQTPGDLVSF